MRKILKGDEVVVICGKDKGRRGSIIQILDNGKVLVQGVNMARKHVKPNPNAGIEGGIVAKEMPMAISNVAIYNAKTEKADRVGVRTDKDGNKERFFKSNGDSIV